MPFCLYFYAPPNTHSARLRDHFNGFSFPAACCSTAEGTIWGQNVTAYVLRSPVGHRKPRYCRWEELKNFRERIDPFLCPKQKNAPPGSTRESVVCRKGHQEDLRRFLRLRMIQLMRMVISIFNYKMQKPARSFHPMLNCASFFGVAPGVIVIGSVTGYYKKVGSQPLKKGGWEPKDL